MSENHAMPHAGDIIVNELNGWKQLVVSECSHHVVGLTLMMKPHRGTDVIEIEFEGERYNMIASMPYVIQKRNYGAIVGRVDEGFLREIKQKMVIELDLVW